MLENEPAGQPLHVELEFAARVVEKLPASFWTTCYHSWTWSSRFMTWKIPATQLMHVEFAVAAAVLDHLPFSHEMHTSTAEAPGPDNEYVPILQAVHVVLETALVAPEKYPAGQLVQLRRDVAASSRPNVPAGQSLHAEEPVASA